MKNAAVSVSLRLDRSQDDASGTQMQATIPKSQNSIQHPTSSLLRRLDRHLRRTRGRRRLALHRRLALGVDLAPQLGRHLEALVVRVLLVKVVFGARLQVGRELAGDALKDGVDGFLLGGVAVPDGDEVVLEADGEAHAAELVVCKG